ncbi:PREDICTED: neurexin-3-like isoform X2 [Acropora digitifera]|uniref:neurexin-3-like isoform X2 n=1 Tax=Acropora digitifera TaxID=70779 RepID=UPI00077A8B23|nr:PREDICTED: neurexin-3-like isoform X2 [Acropora digitifera]
MLTAVIIFQLSFFASSLAGTGLRFSKDPTAFAVFRGWDAKTNGTLKFHFKTHSQNGFLLYEDDKGQCQYMYLSLVDGRLRMKLKMGNCEYTQILLVAQKLADGKWHKVTVQRNFSVTKVTVDRIFQNTTRYHGEGIHIFGVESDLHAGGVPWYTPFNDFSFPAIVYESTNFDRFEGCISGIKHTNGRGSLREAHLLNTSGTVPECLDPCSQNDNCMNGGVCHDTVTEVWCDCKGTGYKGPNCSEEATSLWFNGSGYIVYHMDKTQEKSFLNRTYVAFGIRTLHSRKGVIFSLRSRPVSGFLLMEMDDGKIRVEFNSGGGDYVLESSVHVNDGRWHLVEFSRRGQAVELKINERISAEASLGVKPFQHDVADPNPKVYLGGGPMNILEKSQAKLNLSGEIRELYFGNMELLDHVVPVITDKRFETFGTVIDGSDMPNTSGSGGCDQFEDDEDAECGIPTERTTEIMTSSSTSTPTSHPGPDPRGVQAQDSLPQVVPVWVIPVLVLASVIAILLTVFFLYRWNSRYSGSFKPEPSSSSGELPQQSSKPRIYVTAYEEKA